MQDKVNDLLDGLNILSLALWGVTHPSLEPNKEHHEALAGYADALSLKAKAVSLSLDK